MQGVPLTEVPDTCRTDISQNGMAVLKYLAIRTIKFSASIYVPVKHCVCVRTYIRESTGLNL